MRGLIAKYSSPIVVRHSGKASLLKFLACGVKLTKLEVGFFSSIGGISTFGSAVISPGVGTSFCSCRR